VAVIYNGSDTVTSCSYTTPPDSTQRDEGLPEPVGYIPLLAYGWSLTTWVVTVTLAYTINPSGSMIESGGLAPPCLLPSWLLSVLRPAGLIRVFRFGFRGAWSSP
jgi:hypothetical protein